MCPTICVCLELIADVVTVDTHKVKLYIRVCVFVVDRAYYKIQNRLMILKSKCILTYTKYILTGEMM